MMPGARGARRRRRGRRSRSTPPRPRSRARRSAPGAAFVNDVTALRGDPEMAGVVAESGADVCLDAHAGRAAHDAGRSALRGRGVRGEGVPRGAARASRSREGIAEERVWLDPGIGFGKTLEHNLELLRRLDEIVAIGRPVVVGASRKRFIGALTGQARARAGRRHRGRQRARLRARRHMFRVHDVAADPGCPGGGGCYCGLAVDRWTQR